MNENDFNNGMNGQNQPPIQPNVPPVQDAGTAQNSVPPVQGNAQAAENANPYGAQPVTNAPGQQNIPPQQDVPPGMGGQKPPKQKKKRGIGVIITAVAVAAALVGSLFTAFVVMPLVYGGSLVPKLPTKQEAAQQQETTGESPELGGDAKAIENSQNPAVEIAENISGSVVGITAYTKQLVSGQEPVEQALDAGTGFVISDDGYILTNNHVVADGNLIKVTTPDGQEHVAEKVGGDSNTDIAVLKVDNLGLSAVPIGDSDSVKAGELAVAIGNIRGEKFNNSVTVGHVSIVDKEISLDGITMNMIQTDAAINPGNSGGPLVGEDRKVVGVTTAKKFYSGIDGDGNLLNSEGVGYAIPINKAIDIAQQLIQNGSIPRAGIGISYSPISEVDAKLWGTPRGALIVDITAGGPADKAGLQPNDVVVEMDGVDLTTGADMPVLSEKAVGDIVTAKVWREGKEYEVNFVLEDMNNLG